MRSELTRACPDCRVRLAATATSCPFCRQRLRRAATVKAKGRSSWDVIMRWMRWLVFLVLALLFFAAVGALFGGTLWALASPKPLEHVFLIWMVVAATGIFAWGVAILAFLASPLLWLLLSCSLPAPSMLLLLW